MTWLLHLFPAFRALVAECARLREALQSVTTEKLILQDRLDAAVEDRARLWDMTTKAISEERTAYHSALNVQWQQRGFGAPYPDAPKLPSSAVRENGGGSVGSSFDAPSARVSRATSDFIQSMVSKVTQPTA